MVSLKALDGPYYGQRRDSSCILPGIASLTLSYVVPSDEK